jgi:uncharacterized protein YukE
MGEDTRLEEKIRYNEDNLKKLAEQYGLDHEETLKQRHQIDELYKKLGNGWSGKVQEGIENLQERVTNLEKTDIIINNKLDNVSKDIKELKCRPKETRAKIKDGLYILLALIGVYGFVIGVV